jgi:hypothetical protein
MSLSRLPESEQPKIASSVVTAPPRPKSVETEKKTEEASEKQHPVPGPPQPRTRNAQDKRSPLTKVREEHGLKPGQMDLRIQHRQKELAGRRAYLKNFWYAVGKY